MSADTENEVEAKKAKLDTEEKDVEHTEEASGTETKLMELPRKKFYRQRAHANPLSDREMFHPATPETMDWKEFFGEQYTGDASKVVNADIGCGYGGLLFKLSEVFPDEFSVGYEIRHKVSKYVQDKITALRHNEPGKYQNVCCIRTNAMRFLSHFFRKGQLSRMFFLYPDPHFKKSKHKWRIISLPLISEYAYLMKTGGMLYTVTDVLQYHEWVLENFAATKLFEKIPDEELKEDPIFQFIFDSSEEGKKVSRNEGSKYHAIYRRTNLDPAFEPNFNKKEEVHSDTEETEDKAEEASANEEEPAKDN
ncbi:unnamed protein product [Bursaphelenchus okinawaensis]|uniref:tRNA (guanine-N(7)-)-methyltransferase n=1 Tax=Bursaphelenchus okinawaensis TaxID=465554 RepID=A0A811JT87_9BILA|nr:unnamed protein product [Bursaphelenchus okinawaensis]CAG9081505.1 unnamed protein product [Bursaphelenchus okinawaensis]